MKDEKYLNDLGLAVKHNEVGFLQIGKPFTLITNIDNLLIAECDTDNNTKMTTINCQIFDYMASFKVFKPVKKVCDNIKSLGNGMCRLTVIPTRIEKTITQLNHVGKKDDFAHIICKLN